MDVDRVQDAKGKGEKGKNACQKGKGKDAKGKGNKEEDHRKERKVITRAKARARTRKEKVWQIVTLVGSPDICSRVLEEQYSTGCK